MSMNSPFWILATNFAGMGGRLSLSINGVANLALLSEVTTSPIFRFSPLGDYPLQQPATADPPHTPLQATASHGSPVAHLLIHTSPADASRRSPVAHLQAHLTEHGSLHPPAHGLILTHPLALLDPLGWAEEAMGRRAAAGKGPLIYPHCPRSRSFQCFWEGRHRGRTLSGYS